MRTRERWQLAKSGVVLEREANGVAELLWIHPRLPPERDRAPYPLRVEILSWFADLAATNEALRVVGDFFGRDSVLAAISRRDDSTRFLLYTAASDPVVQERYLGVRAVLRPTAIGLRAAREPAWESLAAIAAAAGAPLSVGAVV
jgi:hypothetical protein